MPPSKKTTKKKPFKPRNPAYYGGSHGGRYPRKVCTKCGEKKPTFEFNKAKSTQDGFTARCTECLTPKVKKTLLESKIESEIKRAALQELLRNHRIEFETLIKKYEEKRGA